MKKEAKKKNIRKKTAAGSTTMIFCVHKDIKVCVTTNKIKIVSLY